MTTLFSKDRWIRNRNNYLIAGRQCKYALTNPNGAYRYGQDDQRVADGVRYWLDRARNAHAIAMGRAPVIANAFVVNGSNPVTSSLFAA